MKNATLGIVLAALGWSALEAAAQGVPTTVGFTGRLVDSQGAPVSGSRDLVLKLFDAPASGTQVWTEPHDGASFTEGLVYLTLGETTALDASVLDGRTMYLEITVDGTVMNPRLAIASVPYAVRAGVAAQADTADSLGGLAPEDVVTSVTAGSGLSGGGAGGDLGLALISCAANQTLVSDGSSWTCADPPAGDITSVNTGASSGLTGGATSGDVTLAANFTVSGGDNGSASTVARGDHVHDGRYYTEIELYGVGVINDAANPVDWTRLKGVPPGLADGVDDDTIYSSGSGILLSSGNVFSADFTIAGGDAGLATNVARGDHLHDARYPIMAGRAGGQTIAGGTAASEDLYLRSTTHATKGEVFLADDGGRVGIGSAGAPSATLDVAGEIRHNAVLKVGSAAPTTYEVSTYKYIIEAPPASVGTVVPIDSALMDQLCRDKDGCDVTIGMVNWNTGLPGSVASRKERLFISETSRDWRIANNDADGIDNNGVLNEWSPWDCTFTDAETFTGAVNGRADATVGWGLLNVAGGTYSDASTTCRVIIED